MAEKEASSGFIPSLFKPAGLLPIAKYKDDLLYTVETHPITIVIGQTGSGKTTQLPQFLKQGGWCADGKSIAVTQPRRVAATSVATRVAEEVGCNIGEEVGYSIRFEDVTGPKTRIKFLTDGLLLREALVDPLLSRYSVIMVDEAHERSLSSDVLLGILKKIRKKRPELHIIVSSATIQAEEFFRFFAGTEYGSSKVGDNTGAIFYISGRMYSVDIHYLTTPCEDYVECAIKTVFDIHSQEAEGDILIFLSGREEIEYCVREINSRSYEYLHKKAPQLLAVSLYAGLPTDQQMSVFEPAPENMRKVVCSTNIAEASVTIESMVYVVDTGLVKLRAYNPETAIETLTAVPISKAAATQRAGRAGRTKPGKCYRLYTSSDYETLLPESTVPEIQRSNLAPLILQLKALGIDNIANFDFLTSPPSVLVTRALDLLYSLGALDDYAKLTKPLGTRMAELSIDPMMAKCLLSSPSFSCLSEMLSIAAMTSLQGSVWFSDEGEGNKAMDGARRKFAAEEGDHLTLLNVYQAFVTKGKKDSKWCSNNHLNYKSMTRAVSIRNQLRRYLERLGINVEESLAPHLAYKRQPGEKMGDVAIGEKIRRCLTTGFFSQAARMQADGSFETVNGGTVLWAHPTSLMFNRKADWVVFHEVLDTGEKTYVRDITKIEKGWLLEYAPEYYSVK